MSQYDVWKDDFDMPDLCKTFGLDYQKDIDTTDYGKEEFN